MSGSVFVGVFDCVCVCVFFMCVCLFVFVHVCFFVCVFVLG